MHYCNYYQAQVVPSEVWFLVAALRSCEHLAFDRTLDTKTSTFEFFVPPDLEPFFLRIIQYFVAQGIVSNVQKLPNRLLAIDAQV